MKNIKYCFFGIIVLLCLIFVYFVTYTFVEPKVYDYMTKHVLTQKLSFDSQKNIYGHDDIVLVVIDEKAVNRYRWPWKREIHCQVLNYFSEYTKAKVIVHDAIISSLDTDNPHSDKKFFDTIGKINNLVEGFMPLGNDEQDVEFENYFVNKYKIDANDQRKYAPNLYQSLSFMPYQYLDKVKNIGSVFVLPGFIDGNLLFMDDVYRVQEPFFSYKGYIFPSLAMKAFLVINDNPQVVIKDKSIDFPELGYSIRTKTSKYMTFCPIRFYNLYDTGYSHKKYSPIDIIDSYNLIKQGKKPIINPHEFDNKIIVYGAYVKAGDGLNDVTNSSMTVNHPGVDIQATALDNLIHNDFLTVLPRWVNILIIIFGMLFVYYTIRIHELFKALSYTILTTILYLSFSVVCFYYGVIVNVITPPVMFVVTMIIAYVHRYVIENRNKEKVKSAMSKYMSADVVKSVLQDIDNLGLGGKKAAVTVLFSDIRGFTSLSEKMTASQVSELLNEYFTEMEPIVTKYNGIINKFIGDAIMAVFGEPIQDKNHPSNAVKCGFEMLQKVKELDEKWEKEGKPRIEIGVGVNTGEVFVGNIGSVNRMEYTVIGDTVNLASRLESYNKTYKTHMLISKSSYEASKDIIEVNKIADVEIRGKAEKMDIYEVIGLK